MKTSKTVVRACRLLRKRVRFEEAHLNLDGGDMGRNDAPKIREATKLYVESWIVPLIDAIERGDMAGLSNLIR